MPTLSSKTTPYYGGGQVVNPANVISTTGAPSTAAIQNGLGTLAVDNANANIYALVSVSGGVATWDLLAGASMGTFTGLTGDNSGTATPNPAIIVAGTANQITTSGASHTLTLSLPSAITAPGSLTTTTTLTSGTTLTVGTTATIGTGLTVTAGGAAITGTTTINNSGSAVTTIGTGGTGAVNIGNATGNTAVTGSLTASTSITATAGNITATNGNLQLSHAGSKLVIHATTAASDSVGIGTLSTGTVTITTSACTTSSKIFVTVLDGNTAGFLSVPSATILNGSFVVSSTNIGDASTFMYLIIN